MTVAAVAPRIGALAALTHLGLSVIRDHAWGPNLAVLVATLCGAMPAMIDEALDWTDTPDDVTCPGCRDLIAMIATPT